MTVKHTRSHSSRRVTDRERRLSLAILGVLALIASAMMVVQGRYKTSAWHEQAAPGAEAQSPARVPEIAPDGDVKDVAAGLVPVSAGDRYDAKTLSDKIDGKADLYLSAGFNGLTSRRFSLAGEKSRWMERFVYDMGSLRNAYTVFSAQRRKNARPAEFTNYAYLAGNGLFFVHGPFYVEIVATEASPEVQRGMNALAMAFIASHPVKSEDIAELKLFPGNHMVPDSLKLAGRSAFGIQGLDGVFTAAYAMDTAEALAFISRCASSSEADTLARKVHAFWLEFGGENVAPPADLQQAGIVLILDNYEICTAHGDYLIGVHEATSLEFGLELIKQLRGNIAGGAP